MSPTLPALPSLHGATRLHDWGVIRAVGAESLKFLHGQLTQDFEHLAPGHARLAGFCSAKGRLLATFVAWRRGDDEVVLACSADVLPAVLKRLSMFVLRAKCKLSDATADVPLWGVAGPIEEIAGITPGALVWDRVAMGGGDAIRLPDAQMAGPAAGQTVQRWLCTGSQPPVAPTLDLSTWLGLEASSGVARVTAATVEQFVPQMVNLELVGGVNFQKGCYPGQEIVARSQYRSTLKRRAQVMGSTTLLTAGQEVFHDADPGQPAGRVVLAGTLPGSGPLALVELKLAALEGGALHAGAPDGPLLQLGALPYSMPTEPA